MAVKILHRELTGNAELVARFHREAKISSRLVHPNVVQVLLTGTLPIAIDGRTGGEVYLVMEYLDGISLLSALAAQGEGGALPLARALHIVLQLCDSVGEAHAQAIVHRDLKPENIMLVRRGEDQDFVKVLDFGIARLDAPNEGHVTQAGLIFGTAKYISPEGAEGKTVGPQADVYAIATILYQCLSGRTPFEGDSPMAVLMQQITAQPKDLRELPRSSYVPDPIAQVVMGNLVKKPQDRADNARALARELELAAREAGIAIDTLSGSSRGDLRLASKQRTKQHQFTAELKQKIATMTPAAGASRPITAYEEIPAGGLKPPPAAPPPNRPSPSGPPAHHDDDVIDLDRPSGGPAPTLIGDCDDPIGPSSDDTIHGSLAAGSSGVSPTEAGAERPRSHPRPAPTVAGSPMDEDPYGPLASAPTRHASGRPSNPGAMPKARPSNPGPTARPSSPGRPSNPGMPAARASSPSISSPRTTGGRSVTPSPTSHPGTEPPRGLTARQGADSGRGLQPVAPARPAGSHAPSPSDGVIEMDAPENGPEPRRLTWRAAVVLLALAAAVPAGAFGAAKLLGDREPAAQEEVVTVDSLLESAQEAMDQRRWDAPTGSNVLELTDRALEISPGDRHVLALRRTAADRILSDALGKKYGGSNDEALRLAKLALRLNPQHAAADHLVEELESPPPVASAEPLPPPEPSAVESADPAASASAAPSASASAAPVATPQKPPGPRPPTAPTSDPGPGNIDDPGTPPGPPEITPPGPSSARPWL